MDRFEREHPLAFWAVVAVVFTAVVYGSFYLMAVMAR
jgi:hypothetical protein